MEQLVIQLLRLVLRLVLFAWTGDWHKLDKLQAQWREFLEQVRNGNAPGQKQPARKVRVPRAPKPRSPWLEGGPAPQPEGDWPFEFAPETVEEEPSEELSGGEVLSVPRPPAPRVPRPPRRPQKELPLAVAIRQPRMLRDAMILTAALGPRPGDRRGRIR